MIGLLAYVGPGPGMSMGWALIVLIATILGSILAVFLWPLRVAMRKLRGSKDEPAALPPSEAEETDVAPLVAPIAAVESEPASNA